MAVDEDIGNQANNNNNGNVMMRLLDAAADEYIDYQATDNESHDVVDAPVGGVPDDIGAVENIENQEYNNNDNQDVVDAPVGNVTDRLFDVNESHDVVYGPVGDAPDNIGAVENIENQEDNNNDNQDVVDAPPVGNITDQLFDVTADENIGNIANNEEIHDVVGAPVDHVADIFEVAAVEIIAAAVETITDIQEHEYEQASDITQINHQLQSIIQQLRLKDDKIDELEARIKELEYWKNTSWPA